MILLTLLVSLVGPVPGDIQMLPHTHILRKGVSHPFQTQVAGVVGPDGRSETSLRGSPPTRLLTRRRLSTPPLEGGCPHGDGRWGNVSDGVPDVDAGPPPLLARPSPPRRGI